MQRWNILFSVSGEIDGEGGNEMRDEECKVIEREREMCSAASCIKGSELNELRIHSTLTAHTLHWCIHVVSSQQSPQSCWTSPVCSFRLIFSFSNLTWATALLSVLHTQSEWCNPVSTSDSNCSQTLQERLHTRLVVILHECCKSFDSTEMQEPRKRM